MAGLKPGDVCKSDPPKGLDGTVTIERLGTAADFMNSNRVWVSYIAAARKCAPPCPSNISIAPPYLLAII